MNDALNDVGNATEARNDARAVVVYDKDLFSLLFGSIEAKVAYPLVPDEVWADRISPVTFLGPLELKVAFNQNRP